MKTHYIPESAYISNNLPKAIETLSGSHLQITDHPLYNLHNVKSVIIFSKNEKKFFKFKILRD